MSQKPKGFLVPQKYIIWVIRLAERVLMIIQSRWSWPHVDLKKQDIYKTTNHLSQDQNSNEASILDYNSTIERLMRKTAESSSSFPKWR